MQRAAQSRLKSAPRARDSGSRSARLRGTRRTARSGAAANDLVDGSREEGRRQVDEHRHREDEVEGAVAVRQCVGGVSLRSASGSRARTISACAFTSTPATPPSRRGAPVLQVGPHVAADLQRGADWEALEEVVPERPAVTPRGDVAPDISVAEGPRPETEEAGAVLSAPLRMLSAAIAPSSAAVAGTLKGLNASEGGADRTIVTPSFLRGERIDLRPLVEADADGPYVSWFNDAETCRGNSHHVRPYTAADARAYIARVAAAPDQLVLAIVAAQGRPAHRQHRAAGHQPGVPHGRALDHARRAQLLGPGLRRRGRARSSATTASAPSTCTASPAARSPATRACGASRSGSGCARRACAGRRRSRTGPTSTSWSTGCCRPNTRRRASPWSSREAA